MNVVLQANSYLSDTGQKCLNLNSSVESNELSLVIHKNSNSLENINNVLLPYFISYWRNKGITLDFKSNQILDNILSTASIDSITPEIFQKVASAYNAQTSLYFNDLIKRQQSIVPIINNGYNAIMRSLNNELYKFLKQHYQIYTDYNIWDNSTWRITTGLQNKTDYPFYDPVLSIDISAQDFTVMYNILGIPYQEDPFTDISNRINVPRPVVKDLLQKIVYGASRQTIMEILYTKNIPVESYYAMLEIEEMDKIYDFINKLSTKDQFSSYYLNRPIPFVRNKEFSRYIQASSSDSLMYILNLLESAGLSKHIALLRHDEIIFYSKDYENDYESIINFFKQNKTLQILHKRPLNFSYKCKIYDS